MAVNKIERRNVQIYMNCLEGTGKGVWRKLHNEELRNPYSSPTIVWVMKSRSRSWTRHVARVGRGEACTDIWWGNVR
jgi:hypothetical protein